MSLAAHKTSPTASPVNSGAPAQSHLFAELLSPNHDAWRVVRKDRSYTFYREVGHDHPRLPFGSIVLRTEPGRPLSFDFYTGRGRRSLLPTYGDEVRQAAQILMDPEYIIALFTKSAVRHSQKSWDHHLSFSGEQLTERSTTLRHGSPLYQRIVGSTHLSLSSLSVGRGELSLPRNEAGLVVSQRERQTPLVRCLISYPRKIEMNFFSSRLTEGLDAITSEMVCLISQLNRGVEERRFFDDNDF